MKIDVKNTDKIAITGISEKTIMSDLFLSEQNINLIQLQTINIINKNYNYKISKQSKNELIIIMRSIYLNNATNNYFTENDLKNELKKLNSIVINYCVDNIIKNINSHLLYLKKINNNRDVIDLPTNTNSKGDKQLQLKSFF